MDRGLELRSFGHIGIVVKDCEATAQSWSALLGIGPWTMMDHGNAKLAHATLGPVKFELIEPVAENIAEDDPPVRRLWLDFLNTQGEGLHHICAFVDDVDAAAGKLEAEGNKIIFLVPGESYVELADPGRVILEVQETP